MFQLTPAALPLSFAFEGSFKPIAWLDNVANPPVWTIGKGLTRLKENGVWRKVRAGDSLNNEDEGDAQVFQFFRDEIEPALGKIFEGVDLQPHQRDALACIAYNAGPYAFPKTAALIKAGAPMSDILDEWVAGEWNNALGLYRRRLMEAIVYGFAWPWQNAYEAAKNANWSTDWRELVGVDPVQPDPAVFDDPELEIPKRGADPIPSWDDLTDAQKTAWLNGDQKAQLETAPKTVQRTKPVGPAPAPAPKPIALEEVKYGIHDPADVGFKPMKVTKRYKGAKNADNGKEMAAVAGTLGGVAAMAGSAKEVTGYFAAYDIRIILVTVFVVSAIGLMIGAVRWWHGRMQEHKGREDASQAMV